MPPDSSMDLSGVTWNPVTGCTKLSPGCLHCYAERIALRLREQGLPAYSRGFRLTLHPRSLSLPLRWKTSRSVFVSSMSDIFHPDVPDDYLLQIFSVMNRASWHRFMALTKRAERLAALAPRLVWTPNIWMGVTVENADCKFRIDLLRRVPARVRFLSFEPLCGPLGPLDLSGIHWAFLGGESGPRARPLHPDWVRSARDQCVAQNVAFYFKQWGGASSRRSSPPLLDGRLWRQMPEEPFSLV